MKRRPRSSWSGASLSAALLAGTIAAASPQFVSATPPPELQDSLLSVSVNGARDGEPVALLRGANDTFYATALVLASWRLPAPGLAFTRDGVGYYLLNAIPGLRIELAEDTQTLSVDARPDTLGWTRLAYAEIEPGEELAGGTGGFLNYDLTAQVAGGQTSMGGALEAGVFTRFGVGIASFVGRVADGAARLVRLDSHWTIDDPKRMRSIRLGDSVSRGGVGGLPLRFGGIQVARNFAVQPGFVTFPLPSLRGSAALPSVVDIYVNDVLSGSRDVPPGPFEISEIPIVTGNGDVRIVVRDLLGREMLYSQSYYAAPTLLRKGLHDYSYEAGLLRRSFGARNNDYGAAMASTTHRYGLTDHVTGEVHAEATHDVQAGGVAVAIGVPGAGQAELSLAGSRSGAGSGAQAAIGLERRTPGLSFGARAEVSSKHYAAIGWDSGRRPPASTIQAFAGLPLGFGSLGAAYLRRKSRGEPDAEFVSASSSIRLRRLGSLHLAARKSLRGERDLAAQLSLSMPLGPLRSASAGVSLRAGERTVTTSIQQYLPAGPGLGYQVAASAGATDRIDGTLSVQSSFGAHDAQLTWVDGKTGLRLSTAGGLGIVGRKAFASRRLTQSFATVKVGDYPNVRVYADNQLVGRTGRNGTLVVPRMRPFERNNLRIELADLPWDAQAPGEQLTIRPYNRHGIAVDFKVTAARAAIIRVLLADGSPLPAGSTVVLDRGPEQFISAPGGEVYLTGLEADNWATAFWPQGSCRFRFPFAPQADPQPRLGDAQCPGIVW